MQQQRRPPLREGKGDHGGRYKLSLAIETRVSHRRNHSLTHLFTHLSLTDTHTPHPRTLCASRHSSCVNGFAFVYTPRNVWGSAWRLCVVAFAARLLGSVARPGLLESALRQLGSSAARRAPGGGLLEAWWLPRLALAAWAAPRLRRRPRSSHRRGCVDGRDRRDARGISDVVTPATSAAALARPQRPHLRSARGGRSLAIADR